VLDTACARVPSDRWRPAALEDCQRVVSRSTPRWRSRAEAITGGESRERREELTRKRTETQARLAELETRWQRSGA